MYMECDMLGIDCHAMQKEFYDLELANELIEYDMFLHRLHAFYVSFAIGLPSPQGKKSDTVFFNTMQHIKNI